jgi:hypothetical protein
MTHPHPDIEKPIITWLRPHIYKAPVIGMPDIVLAKMPSWWPSGEIHRAYFIEEPAELVTLYRGASRRAMPRPDGTIGMKHLDAFERKPSRLNTAEHGLFVPKQNGWPVLTVNEGSQQKTSPNGLGVGYMTGEHSRAGLRPAPI